MYWHKKIENEYFNYHETVNSSNTSLKFRSVIELKNDVVAQEHVSSYLKDVKELKLTCNNFFPWESKAKAESSFSWRWFAVVVVIFAAVYLDNFL